MLISDGTQFKKVISGKNFVTPDINGYFQSGNYQCELSHGRDFDHKLIYGVTIVNTDNMKREYNLDKMFYSRKDALNYIKVLGI